MTIRKVYLDDDPVFLRAVATVSPPTGPVSGVYRPSTVEESTRESGYSCRGVTRDGYPS